MKSIDTFRLHENTSDGGNEPLPHCMEAAARRATVVADHVLASARPQRHGAVLLGGLVLDIQATPANGAQPTHGTTVPGAVVQRPGGVAANVAAALASLQPNECSPPLLITAVGNDAAGPALFSHLSRSGFPTRGVRVVRGARTATVLAVFGSDGDLFSAVADCDVIEAHVTAEWIQRFLPELRAAPFVMVDCNLGAPALLAAASACAPGRLWVEPTSVAKAAACAPLLSFAPTLTPNAAELTSIVAALGTSHAAHGNGGGSAVDGSDATLMRVRIDAEALLHAGASRVFTTLGAAGVLVSTMGASRVAQHDHIPAEPVDAVVSTAGAGDAFVAGAMAASLANEVASSGGGWGEANGTANHDVCVRAARVGLQAAALVVTRAETTPPPEAFERLAHSLELN